MANKEPRKKLDPNYPFDNKEKTSRRERKRNMKINRGVGAHDFHTGEKVLSDNGAQSQADLLRLLSRERDAMAHGLSAFTERGEEWLDRHDRKQAAEGPMSARNEIFQQRMLMMCFMPLARGINAESLTQVFGTYIGMCMVNPSMKDTVRRAKTEILKKWSDHVLGPGVDPHGHNILEGTPFSKKGFRALYTVFNPFTAPLQLAVGKSIDLGKVIDKSLARSNDGRIPFTNESAACEYIGLLRSAHNAMREPGADINEVGKDFDSAVSTLTRLCEADGLDMDKVYEDSRTLMGRWAEYDPKMRTLTNELGYRGVEKGEGTQKRVTSYDAKGNAYTDKRMVWHGEYVNPDNGEPFKGGFTPRTPVTVDSYLMNMQAYVGECLSNCENANDVYTVQAAMTAGLRDGFAWNEEDRAPGKQVFMDDMRANGCDMEAAEALYDRFYDHGVMVKTDFGNDIHQAQTVAAASFEASEEAFHSFAAESPDHADMVRDAVRQHGDAFRGYDFTGGPGARAQGYSQRARTAEQQQRQHKERRMPDMPSGMDGYEATDDFNY